MKSEADRCTCQPGRDHDGSEFGPCEFCERQGDTDMDPSLFYREGTFEELYHKGRDVENTLRNVWIKHRDGGDMVSGLVIARSVCAGIVKEIDEILAKVDKNQVEAVDTFRPAHTVDLTSHAP